MAVDELIADTGFSVDRAIGVADHQLLPDFNSGAGI